MSFFGKLLDDPLKTAAMGAGLYFGGGALAPMMGIGGATAGTGAGLLGAMGPSLPVAGAPLLDAAGATIAPAAGGGMLGSVVPALQAASMAKGLLGGDQQQAPQVPNHTDGGQGLAQLYSGIQQGQQSEMEAEMQKRMKMQGLFGGGNGWTA